MKKIFFKFFNVAKTKHAFTLAETLICLGIIGVVAVLVIPSLIASVTDRARSTQILLSQRKFQKAAELMTLNNAMGGYYADAQDFMETFRGYLKVNAVCRVGDEPSSLPPVTTCWGDDYPGIKLDSGKVVELSTIETGRDFGIPEENQENSWDTNTVAFLDIDGTRRIIAYNTKCKDVAPGVYVGDTSAACIAGVADINGGKSPNKMDEDVYLFGSAQSLGGECPIGEQVEICYYRPKKTADLIASKGFVTASECTENISTWRGYDNMCSLYSNDVGVLNADENWFVATVKECGRWVRIMSREDTAKILNWVYDTDAFVSGSGNADGMNVTVAMTDAHYKRLAKFGLPDPRVVGSVCISNSATNSTTRYTERVCIYPWGTAWSSSKMHGASSMPGNSYLFCRKVQ